MKKVFKKFTAVALASVMAVSAIGSTAMAAGAKSFSYGTGDVNFDEQINMLDVLLMQKHIAGILTLDDEQIWEGDISGNGVIDMEDVLYTQKMVAGILGNRSELIYARMDLRYEILDMMSAYGYVLGTHPDEFADVKEALDNALSVYNSQSINIDEYNNVLDSMWDVKYDSDAYEKMFSYSFEELKGYAATAVNTYDKNAMQTLIDEITADYEESGEYWDLGSVQYWLETYRPMTDKAYLNYVATMILFNYEEYYDSVPDEYKDMFQGFIDICRSAKAISEDPASTDEEVEAIFKDLFFALHEEVDYSKENITSLMDQINELLPSAIDEYDIEMAEDALENGSATLDAYEFTPLLSKIQTVWHLEYALDYLQYPWDWEDEEYVY